MYADPAAIRIKRVNLSLNAAEMRLVEAASEINQMQPSTYLRELVMRALSEQMHANHSHDTHSQMRAAV